MVGRCKQRYSFKSKCKPRCVRVLPHWTAFLYLNEENPTATALGPKTVMFQRSKINPLHAATEIKFILQCRNTSGFARNFSTSLKVNKLFRSLGRDSQFNTGEIKRLRQDPKFCVCPPCADSLDKLYTLSCEFSKGVSSEIKPHVRGSWG